MSKAKKTWLPIVIVLVLAALVILLALVGSQFKDDEKLSETPAPTESEEVSIEKLVEEMIASGELEETPSPEPTQAPEKSTQSTQSSGSDSAKKTESGSGTDSDVYRQFEEYGKRIQDGMKDVTDGISGAINEIGKPFTPDSDGGVILTPKEFSDGVRGVLDGLTGAAQKG